MPAPEAALLVLAPLSASEWRLVGDGLGAPAFDGSGAGAGGASGADPEAIAAILTNAKVGCAAATMRRFPRLAHIHCLGTGRDGIDLAEAERRGVTVTSAGGEHAPVVADHALALHLAVLRMIPALDRATRDHGWTTAAAPRELTGRRVGLLGFGAVGSAVAARLRGFDCDVAYWSRTEKADARARFVGDLDALLAFAEDVVVTLPGGPETAGLLDGRRIALIGPEGVLVNVGRGSVVDTDALVACLTDGRLGAAGLDVVDSEPETPPALAALPNVVLSPHIGGRSPKARRRLVGRAVQVLSEALALRRGLSRAAP